MGYHYGAVEWDSAVSVKVEDSLKLYSPILN